jgi:hypothetical protein
MKVTEFLKKKSACKSAVEWAANQDDYKSAWESCERGDWMLWIAKKQGVDIRVLTKAKVRCARLVQHLMKDKRSLDALDAAEAFADGQASRGNFDASDAAYSAYVDICFSADDADISMHAAAAAFAAADDTGYSSYAASDAAEAAEAAAHASADSAADSARKNMLKQCADICRETIHFEMLKIEEKECAHE